MIGPTLPQEAHSCVVTKRQFAFARLTIRERHS